MGWTLLGGPQESGNHEAALQGEQETAEGRRQAQSPGGVLDRPSDSSQVGAR